MQEVVTLRARREAAGAAFLRKGFRPFFLLAAAWVAVVVPVWLLVHGGTMSVGTYLVPMYWHAHEMVFGYATAVVAGFLLTAAGNWTQRETATGPALLGLALLWLAGRGVMLATDTLPPALVAAVSLAFIPAVAIAVGRVVILARNRRNYAFVAVLAALFAAQLAVHLDALGVAPGGQRIGALVGVDLLILLVLVVGGRVIPVFTRNATGAEARNVPALDRAAIGSVALLAVLDAAGATGRLVAVVCAAGAIFSIARALRWGTRSTADQPLLWVLHVGYAWVPIGLALRAVAAIAPGVPASSGIHALTVGAIGTVTLGMMVRVALGHTGRALAAPKSMTVAFVLVSIAAVARVVSPLTVGAWYMSTMHSAGTLFSLAFLLYLVSIGPMLVRARVDGKPG